MMVAEIVDVSLRDLAQMGGAASFVFLPPFQHDHHQSFMGRPSISAIYLSGVTLAVEVLGWTGLASGKT